MVEFPEGWGECCMNIFWKKAFLMRCLNLQFAVFYHEHVFTKDPGTNHATPWHHDQPYYPVDGWQVT